MQGLFTWKKPRFCHPENSLYKKLVIITVTIASMTVIYDLLSSVIILREIQGYLAINSTEVFWLARGYMFMMVIAPFLTIRMAKLYGYKLIFFLGNLLFITGATLCVMTADYWVMLCFRILGGFGGGMILSVGMPIINFTICDDTKRRPIILAYNNVFFGMGIALGMLFGGYFGQTGHWQLAFHVNILFTAIVMLSALFLFPETDKIPCEPYDYMGLSTITAFALSTLMIVTQAKQPWNTLGWQSPFIHSCLFVSAASLILFVLHSLTTKSPLFDVRLFTYRPFLVGSMAMALVSVMVFGVTMATIGMLEDIYGYEKWKLGTFMSIVGVIYCVVGIFPSLTARYVGFRTYALIGIFLLAASCFLAQNLTIQSDQYQLGAVILTRAMGVSLSLGSVTVWALLCFDDEMYAKGASLITFIRQYGGVLGSGMIMTIADMRKPFHSLRFGEQVNVYSARFTQYFTTFKQSLISNKGEGAVESSKLTKEYIIQWIDNQAQIAGILDAEYLLGWLFLGMFTIMLGTLIYVRVYAIRVP